MSNLQPNCCLKFDFQKVDQHAGGKWLIHDTKCRKDNQLQSLISPAEHPSWVARCDINGSVSTVLNPIFWKKVQGQKRPGRWGIVEHQIPSIKVLFKTNTKGHKHPSIRLLSKSKTQLVNRRKQKVAFRPGTAHSPEIQSYRKWWGAASPILNDTPVVYIYIYISPITELIRNAYIYIYIYINTELDGNWNSPFYMKYVGITYSIDIVLTLSNSGCPAMSPHKIPWLFPDISLTILWFSLTMRHIIGISLLP